MKLKKSLIILILIVAVASIYFFIEKNNLGDREIVEEELIDEELIKETNVNNLDEKNNATVLSNYSDDYIKYTNNPYGYEIILKKGLMLNEDIISVKSRFESEEMVIDILYDDFTDTFDTSEIYNNYGNKGIKENPNFKVTEEYAKDFNDIKGYVVKYERRKLSNISHDRNFYTTIALERSPTEIITVFIKSSSPINIEEIIQEFNFIEKSGEMKSDNVLKPVKKNFDTLTRKFYDNYFINNEKVDFGIFEPSFPAQNQKLKELEEMYGYSFPVVLLYNRFELPYKTEQMNNAREKGKVVEYTLYTMDRLDGKEIEITLDILEGKYDDYLDDLARGFNELDYPVLFRLNNEMNGGWCLYSVYHVGKDTDLFIDCWKYIYNKFQEHGVDNLIFVWNPNERSFPDYSYNHYLNYYPGDEYVDVVGLTAYNTGSYYKGEIWRSFTEAYDHFYYDYAERFEHPLMITEFSTAEAGGDKVAWLDDMFDKISNYDRIKLAVFWNGQDFDMEKPEQPVSRNYRLDLDEKVINSLKNGFEKFK